MQRRSFVKNSAMAAAANNGAGKDNFGNTFSHVPPPNVSVKHKRQKGAGGGTTAITSVDIPIRSDENEQNDNGTRDKENSGNS